ncbi:glycine-rich domain-containing protein [Streptomyces sp. NPDC001407]|uniref:glycine-rich domain-containing protein n=1 Tax=unclassified Streptomyces TaxID=2593676 RepID=UPI0034023B74
MPTVTEAVVQQADAFLAGKKKADGVRPTTCMTVGDRTGPKRTTPKVSLTVVRLHREKGRTVATAVKLREPRTCVAPEVWEREVRLIMRDHEMDQETAERTFGQTIAYLVTSTERPDVRMGPTPSVDLGLHSFVLDTINYTSFCHAIAGHYIHHVPYLPQQKSGRPPSLRETVQAIKAAGFNIDHELWNATASDCSQCHDGCSDSPVGGK